MAKTSSTPPQTAAPLSPKWPNNLKHVIIEVFLLISLVLVLASVLRHEFLMLFS